MQRLQARAGLSTLLCTPHPATAEVLALRFRVSTGTLPACPGATARMTPEFSGFVSATKRGSDLWPLCDLYPGHCPPAEAMLPPGGGGSSLKSRPRCCRRYPVLGAKCHPGQQQGQLPILLRAWAKTSSPSKAPFGFPCLSQQPDLPVITAWQPAPPPPPSTHTHTHTHTQLLWELLWELGPWVAQLHKGRIPRGKDHLLCLHKEVGGTESFLSPILPQPHCTPVVNT